MSVRDRVAECDCRCASSSRSCSRSALFAYAAVPLVDRLMLRWFVRDLEIALDPDRQQSRGAAGAPAQRRLRRARMRALFNAAHPGRAAVCGRAFARRALATPIASRPDFPADVDCESCAGERRGRPQVAHPAAHGMLHFAVRPVRNAAGAIGDSGDRARHELHRAPQRGDAPLSVRISSWHSGALVALITVIVAQLSWRGWVQGMRALLRGEGLMETGRRLCGT